MSYQFLASLWRAHKNGVVIIYKGNVNHHIPCKGALHATYPASIPDIQLPLFTQFNVWGANDPRIADPNTNNGNRHVSCDNTRSIFDDDLVVVSVDDDDGSDREEENDDSSEDADKTTVFLFFDGTRLEW